MRIAALAVPLLLFVSLLLGGCGDKSVSADELAAARVEAGSVNGLCPIMENPVSPTGGSVDYKGQKIAFCCPGCEKDFNADPEKYMTLMKANPSKYGYKP